MNNTPPPAPQRASELPSRQYLRHLQAQVIIDTPLGPLRLAASAKGLAGAWFDAQQHHPGALSVPDDPRHPWLQQAAAEFDAYFSSADGQNEAQRFKVPFDPVGTPFQRAVWHALCDIQGGTLSSYGRLAAQLGRPAAVRAVGAAVGRNPIGIAIPCHRVVGSDGSLTGYAGGLHRKQALLRHEGVALSGTAAMQARDWVARATSPRTRSTAQTSLFDTAAHPAAGEDNR